MKKHRIVGNSTSQSDGTSDGCGRSPKSERILGAGATQRWSRTRPRPDGPLLTGGSRPQIGLSRFPRFESTARVVTKAGPGGTNEVMFWGPGHELAQEGTTTIGTKTIGSISSRGSATARGSPGKSRGREKRLREAMKIPENGKKVAGREGRVPEAEVLLPAMHTPPMLTLGACRSVHQSSCGQ